MSEVVILDGAWGTQLQARGLAAGECPDEWNLSHPDAVTAVAAAYADAGSRIILTNTFRSNAIALAGYGLADRVVELNTAGVAHSLRGAAGRAKVFASVGPSGKVLAAGEITEDELREAFETQVNAIAAGGANGIVIETMSEPAEAIIAVTAARKTGLPVVASMAFDSGRKKDRTMTGATPEQAAAQLTDAGADIIGANCGCGVELYVGICARLHAATSRPIWIKANAGLPELAGGETRYHMGAQEFASYALALRDAGATYVGGCCGTNPDFIRALRAVLGAALSKE
jgi:5-methyltetrahydrofolate--homocysteine methyltransferase